MEMASEAILSIRFRSKDEVRWSPGPVIPTEPNTHLGLLRLTGLQPDTAYEYQLSINGELHPSLIPLGSGLIPCVFVMV
jgi:hypothetical protein